MRRGVALTHFLAGLLALVVVVAVPLTRSKLAADEVECARRRALITAGATLPFEARVCPRSRTPYLYSLTADTSVVATCPNGHGQSPLPLGQWVDSR